MADSARTTACPIIPTPGPCAAEKVSGTGSSGACANSTGPSAANTAEAVSMPANANVNPANFFIILAP